MHPTVKDQIGMKPSQSPPFILIDYNWHRPHSSLGGKTPLERVCELSDKTPFKDEVTSNYNSLKERIQEHNYQIDLLTRKLK